MVDGDFQVPSNRLAFCSLHNFNGQRKTINE
jgi:hypothetical protein